MNGIKKLSIRILIILYGLSYFLQNSFFVDRKKVYAAENPSTTNLVAIFVDKNIYQDIKTNLTRYTTKYLQKKIANSKAVVLPIDTTTLKAHEISQILENMYFEGLKDQNSKLVGTILIGDIPLPVVENNGFVYPSIYPYVDFEDQQFIYDTNKQFFIANDNNNGQAELRHGIIKFDENSAYNIFFNKVRSYYTNPTTFIDKAIWYEDFIGLKKYFIPENTKYYINSLLFSEDIGYHRFNNLLLNILQEEHNKSTLDVGTQLTENADEIEDPELQAYVNNIEQRQTAATQTTQQIKANMPTLTLKTAIQEMLKGYDGMISSQFLAKIKDNVSGLARRYKTTDGETFTDYSSLTNKIAQKDNRLLGDIDNNVQPLLIQINDVLESGLDSKIEEEKYYMTVPVPVSQLDVVGAEKGTVQKKCVWTTYNYYENYFFGKKVDLISTAQETSIFKGTYQNLSTISGQAVSNTGQSIGKSYNIFSTQIEANRGYDFNSTQEELEKYAKYKTNKQSLRMLKCNNYFLNRQRLNICLKPRVRTKSDSADENKCYTNDTELQGGCETMASYAARNRGGASPLNINQNTQKLNNYNYKNAIFPIYNIAGSKKIDNPQNDANSYSGIATYTNMIQKKFAVGDLQNGSNQPLDLIKNPQNNGSDLIFTNQIPVGDLAHPTRSPNPPKTYAQTDYFNKFTTTTFHTTQAGKIFLYNWTLATDDNLCNVQGQIYSYKTVDSRVENKTPTRNQISDTEIYKFKEDSDLEVFYTNVIKNLTQIKTEIIQKNQTFSGASSTDMTGVVSNLTQLKNTIALGNAGLHDMITFVPTWLLTASSSQIAAKAAERNSKGFNLAKTTEIKNRIKKTNQGLESLLSYLNTLSINTTISWFNSIIQSEGFKNQKVEILNTRKTNITQSLDAINSNVALLKNTFIQAQNIYNTIGQIQNSIIALQAQKTTITALQAGYGCTANYYKSICDVLTNNITALNNDLTNINQGLQKLAQYNGDTDGNGNVVVVKPFVEITQEFAAPNVANEILQTKNKMNTFDVSTDINKKEKNKGMNLTTQDRPIDNIRNITFKGIGGDLVRFDYPNLYEIKAYTTSGGKLILKSPEEIREAIKTYLISKATQYNTVLQQQKNKKSQRYQSLSNQFNLLGQIDALANPNTHNYDLIPSNYFVDKVITFLDTLENSPQYGKLAIYGNSNANTTDEKLDMLAKLIYYQNSPRPEKLAKETVVEDIQQVKDSFDINQKISQVTTTYLTEGNNQGKFITPTYNTTGYEVGFINSDGEDYVSSKPVPAFIKQIQNAQEKILSTTKIPANAFIEKTNNSDKVQQQVDSCEGVDAQGTSLIFDMKTMKSPWLKAMKCWMKQSLKFNIEISFKNALGPVLLPGGSGMKQNIINQFSGSNDQATQQRTEYGAQWTLPDNEQIIEQAQGTTKEKLKGYNTYAITKVDKAIIPVDTSTNSKLTINMAKDMGDVNVKISGTGDNCLEIHRNGKVLSPNICTKKAQEYFNPNTENYTFDLIVNQKKSGTTSLMIELCPANSTLCITKQQVITTIPGQIQKISLQSPTDIVMQGAEVPLMIQAIDAYGNSIGQSTQAYTISVQSGDGQIYDGASTNTKIKFDNFATSTFIYQAPKTVTQNKPITITITPNTEKLLTNTTPVSPVQKKLIVAKGVVQVVENNRVLYTTQNRPAIQPKINFNLPKDETDIQYQDTGGTAQINPTRIPSIRIIVQDIHGNNLDTIANITTTNGLLRPGTTKENMIPTTTGTKRQISFAPNNNFIIKDGKLDIALYPNFKAGEDTLTIYIPGLDPIMIPIVVHPGIAKTVLLTLEKNRMDLTTTTSSKGTINVVDNRNNKITSGTTIKLGVIGAANISTNEFVYTGNEYTYTMTTKKPGGEGYVFAYIRDRALTDQMPGYERFIVQESVLPKEKLNIMYLNLFGTDRGNQRGYFSENDKVVNSITTKSTKLLATTTQLVDPNKIKQIEYIVSPNGQIRSINNKEFALTLRNQKFVAVIPNTANITLGNTQDFTISQGENSGAIQTFAKNRNTVLYIPEPLDSIITGNQSTTKKITINGEIALDLDEGTINPSVTITADNEKIAGISTYTMTKNGKKIGTLLIWNNENSTANAVNIDIQDPITYGKTNIFNEGSTNTTASGIYIIASAFSKQGYASIEDSTDAMLGIGFTSKFKNVANFANGDSVGEATLPYGSQFLINFGDPLLERRDKNPNIPNTDFDASIGQTIYADPTKTIFKVIPIDFNKDGIKDLLIIYTDGVVKLVKNYGGTNPYKNLQELMIITEPIKEVHIGDVDGNGYEDIVIITTNSKGLVYLNDKGIFAVDGKNICLNINTEPGTKNQKPEDFSKINQMFVEDMNKDGKLDIVTNDDFADIKIFYGGSTNNGANYISTTTGLCDSQRYTRQKNNYTTVKRFGIRINSSRYIQDQSLVHRKGLEAPQEGITEEVDTQDNTPNTTDTNAVNTLQSMVNNNDTYISQGSSQLAYTSNPLTTKPIYEGLAVDEISYLPINESNTSVSIYKEYSDINGGVLRENDEVAIKTTIISKKNYNKLTYIDDLKGPRNIAKDSNNKISSFIFTTNNTGGILIDWKTENYQFMIDNIQLNSGAKLSFSYKVRYQTQTPTIHIDVADQDLVAQNKIKDTIPDITINSTDSCQKNRWIFFNQNIGNKKTYQQIYDNIQNTITEYNSGAGAIQTNKINETIDQISNATSLESVTALPGMNSLEPRTAKNILSTLTAQGGGSININTNFIDQATANVSKKMDTALKGLCQGFTLSNGESAGCSGLPVPFNQAFLAPGEYHVFGCVPKAPNPLYPIFKTINEKIGKGLPVLFIPGYIPTGTPPYTPLVGSAFVPATFKGIGDGFFSLNPVNSGMPGSQFRLYIAPTLTLGLGIAMCFGPYTVGAAIPKPFRDMGGNCIVFAVPPLTTCESATTTSTAGQPKTENLDPSMIAAAQQGTCNNPPKIGNTIVFANDVGETTTSTTASSPFQMVTAAASSSENATPFSAAIPQGNFGGLIQIDQDPTHVSADEDYGNATEQIEKGTSYQDYNLKNGEKINLKIVGAKTKGLVQCMVKDRSTRQIQYIQNNLTKMTIQIDLPDVTTLTQGFDKIGNLSATYEEINNQDKAGGYIGETQGIGTGKANTITQYFSKQQLNNISQQAGENPFEAIQQMFSEVPLINIDTKDINVKIPALTTEDINKYSSYLKLRVEKAERSIKDWEEFFVSMSQLCKIKGVSQKQTEICLKVNQQNQQFITFKENSAGIIRSVKQNINVLEKYKEFPTQLYEWTHISDRYLTEISALVNDTVGMITTRLDTNANRFSQYVDAITLIVGAIKTRQAVIDFSVNRSEKCSKCSNDNYGSFSCSLSFLCPKLPIFPIPAFKIPNVYMDLSHIDLGMNIILPKINFIPIKIPLPQVPNLPEPPTVEVDWDILYGLNIEFFKDMSLPSIPVIPQPPTLPEPPSFIPSIKLDLPVLPPAPKVPKILPEINAILKVADFIGKVFCIVKGSIGLVAEKGVKGKIEQITQRTRNVPVFDYFDLTTKFKDPPLQGFDYKMDAYTTLKFNFDGVYDVFNNIAKAANEMTSKTVEAGILSGMNIESAIASGVNRVNENANNNIVTDTGFDLINGASQNINFNGYVPAQETEMLDYQVAYNQLKQGLITFKNNANTDTAMSNRVKTILATVENKSTILPASKQIQEVETAAQNIINQKIQENKTTQQQLKSYDTFIKNLRAKETILVADTTTTTSLKTPILTIDSATKTILANQEDPNKTYLTLNQKMVEGYLDALHNDDAQKLNMSETTHQKSTKYLEDTKQKIDTALLAYSDTPLLVAQATCTNCSTTATTENNYSPDISAYVHGVFVESYSGTQKSMINTVISTDHIQNVESTYTTTVDLNNDRFKDVLMYDANTIYIKYAKQQSEHRSQSNTSLTTYYNKFYSYASEHQRNRYISSYDQLKQTADAYGYIDIEDITIKVTSEYKEPKNFKTDGQSFDTLKLSRKNSTQLGEKADAYLIKVSTKVDDKDTPNSFRDFLSPRDKVNYIVALPKGTNYKAGLLTIDETMVKKPIYLELGDRILAVEYYDPSQEKITITLKELPRKRLYTSLATLTIHQEELSNAQQRSLTLYKKTSPRSNQTVAGLQNLGDVTAPVGEFILWRNLTNETISTGILHQGFINTNYTLKSLWTDNVVVAKMVVQKDGQTILTKNNTSQTGTIDIPGLFFTGATKQQFDFITTDQNNNTAKETVTINIAVPTIEVVDVQKNGAETADIIAKISNDLDEGMVIFQRLRNGSRNTIKGSNQNSSGGFNLSPKQTIITGGIFTIGKDIGLYDTLGNEIATINPESGQIKIAQGRETKVKIRLDFSTHIPVIQLKDSIRNTTLFQIVLPVEAITKIQMHQNKPNYESLLLQGDQFGQFTNGYCIQNNKNDCIFYTNNAGAMYIPGIYANSLAGEYRFDTTNKVANYIVKDQSNNPIATLVLKIKTNK